MQIPLDMINKGLIVGTLLVVVLWFFQGCEKTESYKLVFEFPEAQVDVTEETKTLRVYSLISWTEEATCQNLIKEISAPPSEGNYQIEDSEVLTAPFQDAAFHLRTLTKNDVKTRLFFAQGENGGEPPSAILRGCVTVEVGQDAGNELTIPLEVYCPAGWVNCDLHLSGGCETDATTTDNCGSCGNTCVLGCNVDHCMVQFSQIVAGSVHTCGFLKDTGAAYCWGHDDFGQLGDGGDNLNVDVPVKVSGDLSFAQMTAGWYHTCGIASDGSAYCWGYGGFGQLGNGGAGLDYQTPVKVQTLSGVSLAQIAAGANHTCGLTSAGVAYCWGSDTSGQLGNGGGSQDSQTPVLVYGQYSFIQLTTGAYHTCGLLSTGYSYCWGSNDKGQLGDGTTVASQFPVQVGGGYLFSQLKAGANHTCGLTQVGNAVYCWGSDSYGQLGNGGSSADTATPSLVSGGYEFTQLAEGEWHTCALEKDTGVAFCWGSDGYGKLGNGGTNADSQIPVQVSGAGETGPFSQLAVGVYHTCGLTVAGAVYCWGNDRNGQLGNGSLRHESTIPDPVDISGL